MTQVNVFRRSGRPYFEAQWRDPTTEKKKTRSLGTTDKREALRKAAHLEMEIASGRQPANTTWPDAVALYEAEVFPTLAKDSRTKIRSTTRLVAEVIAPARLSGLTESQLARLVASLRERGRTEATVRGHIRNIKAFLRWAVRRQILERVPAMPTLGRGTPGMKGRPITAEEFDRMLSAVPRVVGPERAEGWQRLLRGLWVTGLRLGEALNLDWRNDSKLSVELGGEFPFFRIQAAAEKGRRFRLLPMVPEAGAFFRETPPDLRRGLVFTPVNPKDGRRPSLQWASKVITSIGRAARVAVTEPRKRKRRRAKTETVEPKWASAHDFRRAFGFRLSTRVRAPLLKDLMRHQSVTTTLQFYVGSDAEASARELWREMRAPANDLANTSASEAIHGQPEDSPDP